jgi:pyruvate dehydrogenase E2 component (dihydrolipoamide acetyltransferase)
MQVNITCDHRIIYGAHAAAFLQDLAQLIENDAQSLTL